MRMCNEDASLPDEQHARARKHSLAASGDARAYLPAHRLLRLPQHLRAYMPILSAGPVRDHVSERILVPIAIGPESCVPGMLLGGAHLVLFRRRRGWRFPLAHIFGARLALARGTREIVAR